MKFFGEKLFEKFLPVLFCIRIKFMYFYRKDTP